MEKDKIEFFCSERNRRRTGYNKNDRVFGWKERWIYNKLSNKK